ncbi:RHS repeat-associated core domain-containing protein [Nitrosomonas europaea]|uniref:RHS repeat-associated core domain-containing protein n=1 Tax=Nitrosomonas europaea TaxID=915 RepID=UPI003263480D
MAEYNSGGTLLRRYVHGPGVDEPLVWYEGTTTTNKTWLYQDQLGSVIGTANSAGTSTAIHSYGPYGEPNIATGIRFRYTGQQFLGSLNLYYYKARFYSPALGRFLQTDPIGTADDLNLYAYVGNNPINFNDPSGLSAAAASMLLGKLGSWGRENAGTLAEIGIGFTPAGFYTDLYSAVAGRTPITGDSLSGWERALVLIPGVSEIRNAGRVVSAVSAAPLVKWSAQEKHFPGHNSYEPGKSILTSDPTKLAKQAGTGQQVGKIPVGTPGSKERVNFGENIGTYIDKAGNASPTTNGMIHYSKDGIHIVPARP